VTVYDWPRAGRPERADDQRARQSFNASRGALVGGTITEPTGATRPRAAPSGAVDLWAPIGPTAVLGSDKAGSPRVTGRISDVWIEPTAGLRAYAAAATGGVWYTDDGGATWKALGGWRAADPAAASLVASPLANGCLLVEFHDDPGDDEVWVGTGEGPLLMDDETPSGIPGHKLSGIGVLHAVGPSTKPETDPVFSAQATNLLGAGIFRLARQPGGTGFVAATTKGLVERPSGSGPQAKWLPVTNIPTGDHDQALPCTDTLWTPSAGTQQGRLWVALRRPGSGQMELWCRSDGDTEFKRVALPTGAGGSPPVTRLSLGVSPSGDTIWVLGDGPRVWRIDASVATPTGVLVPRQTLPRVWKGKSIHASKMVVAVDPSNPANIALGGTADAPDAALFIGVVTGPAAGPLTFTLAGSHRGRGVHPDILAIRFTADGKRVWVACDGGVFVSASSGQEGTFVARNTGLPVVEAGFVACHPTNDTAVVLGAQDNATQRRVGEVTWHWEQGGDGGGVAFDQVTTHQYVAQYIRSDWSNGPTNPQPPVQRANTNWTAEDKAAAYYSTPATIANGAVNQLAVGTNRVWYTQDWGAHWVTLPNGVNDPMAGGVNSVQDVLPKAGGAVRVLRWATADRLWVLCGRGLYQMQRDAHGRWTRADLSLQDVLHPAKSTDVAASDVGNDIAVHNPAAGPFGSLYLAMLGDLSTDDDDLLWWWDGTSKWHKTGLASKTTAAALAVAVEPGHIDTVYVGTAIGVFRASITFDGDKPSWPNWTRLDNGLPDAAVQDLAIFSRGPIRLLRAATQARGVWELDLSGPVTDRTYLRVHQDDTRRTLPTSLAAPFEPKIADPADATKQIDTTYRWHASPDLRVHPKLGAMAAPASLPWTKAHPEGTHADRFGAWKLWRFQAALRCEDLRSEAKGVWYDEFDAVLLANGVPTPGGTATITKAYWESKVTGVNINRLPWDTPQPAEADLAEYLPAEANPFGDQQPSVLVPRGVITAYVMLHHRGATPAATADVQTTLLYRVVPSWHGKASTAWLPGAVEWTASIADLLTDGTNSALPAGWVLADMADPRHSPATDTAAGSPAVTTFDVDLSTVKDKALVLLVAVVHSANDHVSLTELPLRDLTLASPHVAVRSVQVRI
jgi:hypothetical protein